MKNFLVKTFALATVALTAVESFAFRANTASANSVDSEWSSRHAEKSAAVTAGTAGNVVFIGDEITQGWETTGAAALAQYFTGTKTMFNLGFRGDCTEHVLWRIQNGELASAPKAIFLMIGGNNTALYTEAEEPTGQTSVGVRDIIDNLVSTRGSTTKIIVQAILPRGADESDPYRYRNDLVNRDLRATAAEKGCSWVDMSDLFLESDGHTLKTSLFNDDKVTLNAAGYAVWAQAVSSYVEAAVNGTTMPADRVPAKARPVTTLPDCALPSFTAVMPNFFWEKYNYDISYVGRSDYDIVLLGDSITQKWSATDPSSMGGLASRVYNMGRSGDFTENLLWRLNAGCLDGYTTKFFNLLIGTNNTVQRGGVADMDDPADIAAGVRSILDLVLAKHPESKVLLTPILPYGSKSTPEAAAAMFANNEAANDIIRTYADNERVFLVNVDTNKFYLSDGTCNPEMYDGVEASIYYLHLSAKGYSEIVAPAIKAAMTAAGESSVVLPSFGGATPTVHGTSATISLSGVTSGSDAAGVATSTYKVCYKLDTAAEVTLSAAQSGSSATLSFTDLSDGWHSCAVWVTTDGTVKSEPKRVKFQIDSQADAVGWKVAPMDETGSAFRSDGTQIFAKGYTAKTANGVAFSSGFPSSDVMTASPTKSEETGWGQNNPVFGGAWFMPKSGTPQDVVFTFKGLTAAKKYVAQILVGNYWNDSSTTITAGDLTPFEATKNNDYKCGAVISRVFVATASEEAVTISYSGSFSKCMVKAIQLRELAADESGSGESGGGQSESGEVGPVGGTDPIGDLTSAPCTPTQRLDDYGVTHFNEDVNQSQGKAFDAVLFGDSITDFWVNPNLSFDGDLSKTINMGIGSDRTQNLLWRVKNGALDGYTSKYFTLLIGVNNAYQKRMDENIHCDRAEDVAESIRLILREIVAKHPESKIILMPILPYGFESRYYDAIEVRNTNEDVNDYIIKFVDNKRIFWVDLRSQYINADASCNPACFRDGTYDAVGHYLHPNTSTYPSIFKPALSAAMAKYLNAAVGTAQVADPSLGYASAVPNGVDNTVAITVRGIFLGTNAQAVPVTSYSIAYELDGGALTPALQNQTLTRNTFTIPNVARGDHTCRVTVTTADGKVMTTSVDFTMGEGWTGTPLTADASSVRTDGTLAYAYAIGNYTVNGVTFASGRTGVNDDNITWPYGIDSMSTAPEGVASGAYKELLTHCWWAGSGEKTVTLKNLTAGKKYLVQIFGYRNYEGFDKNHIWIAESFRDVNYIKILGEGWTCGGVLTGYFTASAATKTFTICADGNHALNGIQVRELGDSGYIPVVTVNPSIASVTAVTNGAAATISLTGVVMGTDGNGTNATSYVVSYSLNGAAPVSKLTNQTGATASFTITDLADANYTCAVTVTTDAGKTVTKSVSFTISTATSGGESGGESGGSSETIVTTGWTVTVPTTTDGLLCTTGTLVYAYAPKALTVGGISFTGDETLANTDFTVDQTYSGYDSNMGASSLSGDWANLMKQTWRWSNTIGTLQLTLKGLESGNDYLVQVLSRNGWSNVKIGVGDVEKQSNNGSYGVSVVGVFTASGSSQTVAIAYGGDAGWRTINAIQVRKLDAGSVSPSEPVDPPAPTVFSLTIPAAANMTLASVTTNGVALSATAGAYSVVSNTEVKVTFTAAEGYEFEGNDYVTVTVTANMTLATYPTVRQKAASGGDDPEPQPPATVTLGWTAEPMEADASTVKTNGTLKYAYRGKFDWDSGVKSTINTVDFQKVNVLSDVTDFSVSKTMSFADYLGEESGGSYGSLMPQGFRNDSSGDCTFTLNGLEKGKSYLVQLLIHWSGKSTFTACPSGVTDKTIQFGGTGWTYGGSLTGVFTATGSTQDIAINYSNNAIFNAIQVREVEVAAEEEEVTVSPGQTVTVDSLAEANAVVVKIADDATKAAGQANVVKRVIKQNAAGKYEVTVGIDEEKIVSPDQTLAAFASNGLANIASRESAVDVTIPSDKVTAGLYYSVQCSSGLAFDGADETDRVLATGGNVVIRVQRMTGAKQFFKVAVNLTDK